MYQLRFLVVNKRNQLVLSRYENICEGHWVGFRNDRKSKEPDLGQGQ